MTKVIKKTEEQIAQAREKRALLCQLTAQAREIREQLTTSSTSPTQIEFIMTRPLNYFIVNYIYQNEARTLNFKTFNEWKKEGATVKKGSKAYIIWGQPLKKQKDEQPEQQKSDEKKPMKDDFYPLCYLFSNEQVHFNKQQESSKEPTEQREKTQVAVTSVDIDSCL